MPKPKVSVGLPVYNGENYLAEALDSFLSQTFDDFEIVISDNASEDQTEIIARRYAAADSRIQYHRQPKNLGASSNYAKVFELSTGEYFKWAAHDDICAPEYLEQCVDRLSSDPSIAIAHTAAAPLYPDGSVGAPWPSIPELESNESVARFAKILRIGPEISYVWGLTRKEQLSKTKLLGSYTGHDRPLLSSLSLMGRIVQAPEVLFYQREHPARSVHTHNWSDRHKAISWYDPLLTGKLVFPSWRILKEHLAGVARSSLNFRTKLECCKEILRWAGDRKHNLVSDLLFAGNRLPVLGRLEFRKIDTLFRRIWANIPRGSGFILVHEEQLVTDLFKEWSITPFLEKDGRYWGLPRDDNEAIRELKRLRSEGNEFIVFCDHTFWWLEHYLEFDDYLKSNFALLVNDDKFMIFDLR